MVVAQFAETSIPVPEVRGSNPNSSKILWWTYFLLTVWKDEYREKEAVKKSHFYKAD